MKHHISIVFLGIVFSVGSFRSSQVIFAQAYSQPKSATLEIQLTSDVALQDTQDMIQETMYERVILEGHFMVGTDTITDFVEKEKGENLDGLDQEFKVNRQSFLTNLEKTHTLSQKKRSYTLDQINQAKHDIESLDPVIERFTLITDDEAEAVQIRDTLSRNLQVQSVQISTPADQNKGELFPVSGQDNPTWRSQIERFETWISGMLALLAPVKHAIAETIPDWVPDYVNISFFDTDEIGLNPFETWQTIQNGGTPVSIQDSASHWWRTYLIAEGVGVSQGKDYIGHFTDESGTIFSGWREISSGDVTNHHSLVSTGNTLYHLYTNDNLGSIPPFKLSVRQSQDGGYTWSQGTLIAEDIRNYAASMHNGQICLALERHSTSKLQIGCNSQASTGWDTVSFQGFGVEVSSLGGRHLELESAFGTLWIAYADKTNNHEIKVKSSYDNGVTWQDIPGIESKSAMGGIELTGLGKSDWQNERLCLTTGDGGQGSEVYQSCLYRYGEGYNQWNWHPWQAQGVKTGGELGDTVQTVSDSSRMTQIVQDNPEDFQTRTLEWQNPGARGYISWFRWDNEPFKDTWMAPGFELDIFFSNNQENSYETYLTKKEEVEFPYCIPYVKYAASNLPNPYIDTRYTEEEECDTVQSEVSYTIGTGNAHDISQDRNYMIYWETEKGERDRPVFKVQATRTHKNCALALLIPHPIPLNQDTWCYFTDSHFSPNPFDILPFNNSLNMISRENKYPYWYSEYRK